MRFVIKKEVLLGVLQNLVPVVEKKQTKPILGNLHISVENNFCCITTTDNEIQIQQKVSVDFMQAAGKTTFSAKKCLDICRSLANDDLVEIYTNGRQTILKSDQSRFVLASLPEEAFPFFKAAQSDVYFEVPQKKLKAILSRCYFAMAIEDIRTYLNGLFIRINHERVLGVSTDGHRLAMHEELLGEHKDQDNAQTEVVEEDPLGFILPRKAVSELYKLLNNEGNIRVCVTKTHLLAEFNQIKFSSALIGGRYPNYNRVIPKIGDTYCVIDKEAFRQALNRSLILCNEKLRGARFLFEQGHLTLTAHNVEQEEARNQVAIDYSGEPLETAFNLGYMLDILNVLEDDSIKISFAQLNGSIIIEELNHAGSLFVVMVMQV